MRTFIYYFLICTSIWIPIEVTWSAQRADGPSTATGTVTGTTTIQIDAGNINNIISNSNDARAKVSVGRIKNSHIRGSVNTNINIGDINNKLSNSSNSTSAIKIGNIENSDVNQVELSVDVKQVESNVNGGSKNRSMTRIGSIENSRISGRVNLHIKGTQINNIQSGGNNNRSEISIGSITDCDDDEPDCDFQTHSVSNSGTGAAVASPIANATLKPVTSVTAVTAATSPSPTPTANRQDANPPGHSSSSRPKQLNLRDSNMTNDLNTIREKLSSFTFTPLSMEWHMKHGYSHKMLDYDSKVMSRFGDAHNALILKNDELILKAISLYDGPTDAFLKALRNPDSEIVLYSGIKYDPSRLDKLSEKDIKQLKRQFLAGTLKQAKLYVNDILPRTKNIVSNYYDPRTRSRLFYKNLKVNSNKYHPLVVATESRKLDHTAETILKISLEMRNDPAAYLAKEFQKVNADLSGPIVMTGRWNAPTRIYGKIMKEAVAAGNLARIRNAKNTQASLLRARLISKPHYQKNIKALNRLELKILAKPKRISRK